MKKLILALAAVMMITAVTACSPQEESDGLQYVTVDGITVDITQGSEALEAALGERFAVMINMVTFPEGKSQEKVLFSHVETVDADTYKGEMYYAAKVDSGEPAEVTVFRGAAADISFTDYKKLYNGLYFDSVYDFVFADNYDETMLVQADGILITPEQLRADMEASGLEAESEYGYLISLLENGEINELIILHNMFDGEVCFYCSLQYFTAK